MSIALTAPAGAAPERVSSEPISLFEPSSPIVVVVLNIVLMVVFQSDPEVVSNTVRVGYLGFALATLTAAALAPLRNALPLLLTMLIYAPITDAVTHLPVYGLRACELLAAGLLAARYGRMSTAVLMIALYGAVHAGRFITYQDSREHLYWAMQAFAGAFLTMVHRGCRKAGMPVSRLMWTALGASFAVFGLCLVAAVRAGENLSDFVLNVRRLGLLDGASCNSLAFVCGAALLWSLTLPGRAGIWATRVAGAIVMGAGCLMTKTFGVIFVTFTTYGLLILLAARGWRSKALIAFTGLVIVLSAWRPELKDDILNIEEKDFVTLSSRTIVWDRCFDIIRANPVLGIDYSEYESGGLSTTYLLRSGEVQMAALTPHNAILAGFTFGGWVGGGLFVLYHVFVFYGARRNILRLTPAVRAVLGLGFFALVTHFFMDVWYTYYYFLAGIPLALPGWGEATKTTTEASRA